MVSKRLLRHGEALRHDRAPRAEKVYAENQLQSVDFRAARQIQQIRHEQHR